MICTYLCNTPFAQSMSFQNRHLGVLCDQLFDIHGSGDKVNKILLCFRCTWWERSGNFGLCNFGCCRCGNVDLAIVTPLKTFLFV